MKKFLWLISLLLFLPSSVNAQLGGYLSNPPGTGQLQIDIDPTTEGLCGYDSLNDDIECGDGASTLHTEMTSRKGAVNGYASLGADALHAADEMRWYTNAGTPSAASCVSYELWNDTSNDIPFHCAEGPGGDPTSFGALGDAYNSVHDGSATVSASGSEQLNLIAGSNMTVACVAGTPDVCTFTSSGGAPSQLHVFTPNQYEPSATSGIVSADWDVRNGRPNLVFAFDTANEDACFSGIFNRGYSAGAASVDIVFDCDTNTAASEVVKWDVAFEIGTSLDFDTDSFDTVQSNTGTCSTTAGVTTTTTVSFADANEMDGISGGVPFRMCVERDNQDAADTEDDNNARVYFVEIRQ